MSSKSKSKANKSEKKSVPAPSPSPSPKAVKPEKPQYSTAISDAILATMTLYAVSALWATASAYLRTRDPRGPVAGQWMLLAAGALGVSGAAAAVGTLRFAGVSAVRPTHEFLTKIAMFFSMPV